jgi:hypothetical protein
MLVIPGRITHPHQRAKLPDAATAQWWGFAGHIRSNFKGQLRLAVDYLFARQ